jgi:pimeloyl-ACP methyl ester carboxylesterase
MQWTSTRPRGRSAVRLGVWLALAVAIGLGLGLAVDVVRLGGPEGWLAARGWSPPYESLGRLVTVGDRQLYLDCRGAGSPTVVLENGLGSGADGWGFVLPRVADRTRVCAYDRAGIGRSTAAPRRTVADAVEELHQLLAAAGERPPYVLVGMSLGGSHVRMFGSAHKGEVAGIVLVDAYLPDADYAYGLGLDSGMLDDWARGLDDTSRTIEAVEHLDWVASVEQLKASTLAGLPVEVLTVDQHLRFVDPHLSAADVERLIAAQRRWIEALSPGRTRLTVADRSGHVIQLDRPDLVIGAIDRLVDLARAPRQ